MALALLTYVNLVAALVASRMAFDAYGETDLAAIGIFSAGVVVAYVLGGFSNFFLRRPFVSDAIFALLVMVTLAAFLIFQFTTQNRSLNEPGTVDWRLIPAAVLILFALWILAAVALACSTRLDMIPTLAICSAVFLLGTMSDYLLGRRAVPVWRQDVTEELRSPRWSQSQKALLKEILTRYDKDQNGTLDPGERDQISEPDQARLRRAGMGSAWWASVLYTVTPNWQIFWLADALEEGRSTFHWGYVAKAFAYTAAYVGAMLVLAVLLFEQRELS
jgi:hypothetical protein